MYFIFSLENNGDTVPNKLEITSCVTSLGTHPTNKHLITAGLYNGTTKVFLKIKYVRYSNTF